MALELRQQLKLTQQLVMTPQLQQAIKLLQLSRLELLDSVQQELMENPCLEESMEEGPLETPALDNQESQDTADIVEMETPGESTGSETDLMRNAEWDDYLGDFSSISKQSLARETEIPEEGLSFEARLTMSHSLEGHLAWQLRLSRFSEKQMEIGEAVIGNLDHLGYLNMTAAELTEQTGASEEVVEATLARIQRFDPVGVACRNAQECLEVQMDALGFKEDPILTSLVREHLEDLEKRRYKPLARKFKISMEELKEYLDLLQTLDPMPGASFSGSEPQYVSPDVFVYKFGDDFVIMLNEDGLPRLQLNPTYLDPQVAGGESQKEYIQDKMRSAVWLMKSLYQRQRTLYKVVESLVKFQRGFFEEGVSQLRPLILKDVAEDIEMHESTVSRITTNKYVATPHGVYELKFFFNSALGLDNGGSVGSESVKALIKKLISGENPKKPLSDDKIADMLKEELEVNIARRTVAKYRTALGIASSSKRKQVF